MWGLKRANEQLSHKRIYVSALNPSIYFSKEGTSSLWKTSTRCNNRSPSNHVIHLQREYTSLISSDFSLS